MFEGIPADVALQVPALFVFAAVLYMITKGNSKERAASEDRQAEERQATLAAVAAEREKDRQERAAIATLIKSLGDSCHSFAEDREDKLIAALEKTNNAMQAFAVGAANCNVQCKSFRPDPRRGWLNTTDEAQDVEVDGSALTVPPDHGVIQGPDGARVATPEQYAAFRQQQRHHRRQG